MAGLGGLFGQNSTNATSNTTTTTTTPSSNLTTTLVYDAFAAFRCYPDELDSDQFKIIKYLLYFCCAWIVIWCIITTLVNLCHKNGGNQRCLQFFEELSICALAVFVCVLNLQFTDNEKYCKFTAIGSHFFMVLTAAIFFMESFFASSMVHGKANKNGCMPYPLYYLLPIPLAAGPVAGAYFWQKDYYGTAALHCFAVSTVNMLWGFVLPVWALIALTGLKAQLACIACDKNTETQNEKQCFWARRSVKSLLMLALFLFSIWLMIMFAFEHQQLFLFIIATVLCLVFGPTLFVIHTFCHMNTCQKWGGDGCCSSLYAMCPPKPEKEKPKDEEKEKEKDEDEEPYKPPPPAEEPIQNVPKNQEPLSLKTRPLTPIGDTPHYYEPDAEAAKAPYKTPSSHTPASKFYSWLTDSNGKLTSKDVLFRPTPY